MRAYALRGIELLAMGPWSAREFSEGLGVNIRTARRLLQTFEEAGYVTATPGLPAMYQPTMRVVAIAGQTIERNEMVQAVTPHLTALRDLGDSAHLCVPSWLSAVCIAHAGPETDHVRPRVRELVPCHCTAAGKALLAWRKRWREAVLCEPLEAFTERTRTGPDYLRRELAVTVARGYAIENGEYQEGVRGLAVPVLVKGEAVASLGVVGVAAEDQDRIALVLSGIAGRL